MHISVGPGVAAILRFLACHPRNSLTKGENHGDFYDSDRERKRFCEKERESIDIDSQ
ncbi:MAG: hypothetical protein QM811_19340 [Pirellulales bacterium]